LIIKKQIDNSYIAFYNKSKKDELLLKKYLEIQKKRFDIIKNNIKIKFRRY
jgi:hypothetical protein